jgi:hypothetical protein
MIIDLVKKLRRSDPKRSLPFARVLVRVRNGLDKTADHSAERLPEPATRLRRSDKASSTGAILPSVSKFPHVANHSSYWRRLDTDPGFAAEMSERQRRIGQY